MPRETGRYENSTVGGVTLRAFVPHPLPPADPPLALDGALRGRLARAEQAVGRLALAATLTPSADAYASAFSKKEAILSDRLSGGGATLPALFAVEAGLDGESEGRTDSGDTRDIRNYLDAMEFARDNRSGHPEPLNEAHRLLLREDANAGGPAVGIREEQNWVGDTASRASYVPPPPERVPAVLGAFQRYIQTPDGRAPLIRVGLLHAQFDAIHPYLRGNDRMGRLLITLLLEHWGLLPRPLLYLSLFFKQRHGEYPRRLHAVRGSGDWEGWLAFFLDGVATVADDATATMRDLQELGAAARSRILKYHAASVVSLQLLEVLPQHPVVTGRSVVRILGVTRPTAGKAIDVLEQCGVLVETTGRKRDRVYHYARYIERLCDGMDAAQG